MSPILCLFAGLFVGCYFEPYAVCRLLCGCLWVVNGRFGNQTGPVEDLFVFGSRPVMKQPTCRPRTFPEQALPSSHCAGGSLSVCAWFGAGSFCVTSLGGLFASGSGSVCGGQRACFFRVSRLHVCSPECPVFVVFQPCFQFV